MLTSKRFWTSSKTSESCSVANVIAKPLVPKRAARLTFFLKKMNLIFKLRKDREKKYKKKNKKNKNILCEDKNQHLWAYRS